MKNVCATVAMQTKQQCQQNENYYYGFSNIENKAGTNPKG